MAAAPGPSAAEGTEDSHAVPSPPTLDNSPPPPPLLDHAWSPSTPARPYPDHEPWVPYVPPPPLPGARPPPPSPPRPLPKPRLPTRAPSFKPSRAPSFPRFSGQGAVVGPSPLVTMRLVLTASSAKEAAKMQRPAALKALEAALRSTLALSADDSINVIAAIVHQRSTRRLDVSGMGNDEVWEVSVRLEIHMASNSRAASIRTQLARDEFPGEEFVEELHANLQARGIDITPQLLSVSEDSLDDNDKTAVPTPATTAAVNTSARDGTSSSEKDSDGGMLGFTTLPAWLLYSSLGLVVLLLASVLGYALCVSWQKRRRKKSTVAHASKPGDDVNKALKRIKNSSGKAVGPRPGSRPSTTGSDATTAVNVVAPVERPSSKVSGARSLDEAPPRPPKVDKTPPKVDKIVPKVDKMVPHPPTICKVPTSPTPPTSPPPASPGLTARRKAPEAASPDSSRPTTSTTDSTAAGSSSICSTSGTGTGSRTTRKSSSRDDFTPQVRPRTPPMTQMQRTTRKTTARPATVEQPAIPVATTNDPRPATTG